MNIEFSKKFEKKIESIDDKILLEKISACVKNIINATNTKEIKNIKKLKGYKSFYRIKISDYRVGIYLDDHATIWFADFAHRKDIYKIFP
jgi:mRNA interferase RelE/StbE